MSDSHRVDGLPSTPPVTERRRDFNDFSLVWARYGCGVYPHLFDRTMVVSVFERASIRLDVCDKRTSVNYQLEGQHVSLIPAGVTYTSEWRTSAELIRWFIARQVIDRVTYESISEGSIELPERYMVRDSFIEQLSRSLRAEFESGAPSVLYAESIVTVLLTHLIRNYAVNVKPLGYLAKALSPSQFRKARDYIEAHLGEDLSLREIADELGMSTHYFSELFRNSVGLSPYRHITRRRIEEAKRLLSRADLRLVDIALELGFSSQSRFTEAFTRVVGVTPLTYRKRI
jgi:AraC family transcriptional regulator